MPEKASVRRGRPREFDEDHALELAMHAFWLHGYDNTSMKDVAAATGLALPSIYSAFGNKDAVYRRVVARYAGLEGGLTARAMDEGATARQAVSMMLHRHIDLFTRYPERRGCMIVLGLANASGAGDDVLDDLRRRRAEVGDLILRRMRRAAREGDLPVGASPEVVATVCHTFLNGLSTQIVDGIPVELLRDAVDRLVAVWWPAPSDLPI